MAISHAIVTVLDIQSIGLMEKIARKKRIISEPRGSDKMDFEEQMKLFYDAVQPTPGSERDSDGTEQLLTSLS